MIEHAHGVCAAPEAETGVRSEEEHTRFYKMMQGSVLIHQYPTVSPEEP